MTSAPPPPEGVSDRSLYEPEVATAERPSTRPAGNVIPSTRARTRRLSARSRSVFLIFVSTWYAKISPLQMTPYRRPRTSHPIRNLANAQPSRRMSLDLQLPLRNPPQPLRPLIPPMSSICTQPVPALIPQIPLRSRPVPINPRNPLNTLNPANRRNPVPRSVHRPRPHPALTNPLRPAEKPPHARPLQHFHAPKILYTRLTMHPFLYGGLCMKQKKKNGGGEGGVCTSGRPDFPLGGGGGGVPGGVWQGPGRGRPA